MLLSGFLDPDWLGCFLKLSFMIRETNNVSYFRPIVCTEQQTCQEQIQDKQSPNL